MKLSAKSEYALMALLDMALYSEGGPVQVKSIARRQAIPARFLEQVMSALKRGGVVESFRGALRGARGGYLLVKKPEEILLSEVLETVDGPFGQREAAPPEGENGFHHPQSVKGVIKDVWGEMTQTMIRTLGSVTLQEMCERKRKKDQEQVFMYHI
ncbi:MAG: Rrf2 family transcriptional regulator [Nitrospirae bacterium]|nr:Rrf2 family transcriptional regulator [Nitrospirota bacterium]